MAKRCKICHAVRDKLTEGRCHSCYVAFQASQNGMTYGKYSATIPHDTPARRAEVVLPVEEEELHKCKYCDAIITKNRTICGSLECGRKRSAEKYRKARERLLAKRGEPEKIRCANCGKKFRPRNGKIKYCSEDCRNDAKRKRERSARRTGGMGMYDYD